MLVKSQTVSDYEGFQKIIKNLEDKGESAVLIISGSRDETGKSWCPDCVKAEPVVEKYLSTKITKHLNLVRIELEYHYFKDPKNPFRTSSKVRLTRIPTLMFWPGIKRLEENECGNDELLDLFFEDYIS
ncbi:thioredoxin domain-containing protein 17-like [Rhodnius prolixus]|uniref:thioredoxin domain-containing protein 17-like n=1 Tax=Rhodnius prolixus TaxID=13249 RepID=UPI003D18F42A